MSDSDLDTAGRRLEWARARAGFESATAFAKEMGLNPTSYRAYENDQNGFARHAPWFGEKLGVSSDWLIRGGPTPQGDPPRFRPAQVVSTPSAIADRYNLEFVKELELGYSMGGGSVFSEYPQVGFRAFDRDFLSRLTRGSVGGLFVARGDGDSMQPTLWHDDSVLIDTSQNAITQQDRIWAISYGDLGMIKRVRRLPGGRFLIISDNPTVAPFEAAEDEIHVVGRVVWIGRRM